MKQTILKLLIQKLLLQLQILKIRLAIILLKQKRTIPNLPKPRYVIIHHGAGDWTFNQVNNHHKNIWGFKSSLGFYIGYQKFIEFDGTLYIARKDNEQGAHTKGFNKMTVGICLQGNMEEMLPTEAQLKTLKRELDKYDIPIREHRNFTPTLCPGRNLSKWLEQYKGRS